MYSTYKSLRLPFVMAQMVLPVLDELTEEFISLAETHQEEMSRLCNQCSLLTHSVAGNGSNVGSAPSTMVSSATHHSMSSRDNMLSIVHRINLYQNVMDYKVTIESIQTLHERMGQILEEAMGGKGSNQGFLMEKRKRIDDSDHDSLMSYHVGLCRRAMKTCLHSTIEQEAYAIDQHTYECRTAALAALSASLSQLKKLKEAR